VKAGSKTDVLLNSVDIMPTLLGLTKTEIPSVVQGTDLSSFALGRDGEEPDSLLLMHLTPLRYGGDRYEAWRGVRTKRYTYARFRDKGWMLYDNNRDPFQLNNLIDKPEASGIQKKLEAKLQDWLKRTGDDFAPGEEWLKRLGRRPRATGESEG
jgi:arylsulfatase A-like enzyme